MGLVSWYHAGVTILGVAASARLGAKAATHSRQRASTVYIASVTQEASAASRPSAGHSNCRATVSETSLRIFSAGQRRPSQSEQPDDDGPAGAAGGSGSSECQRPGPSTISKALVDETTRITHAHGGRHDNRKELSLISNWSFIEEEPERRGDERNINSVSSCYERRPAGWRDRGSQGRIAQTRRSPSRLADRAEVHRDRRSGDLGIFQQG